MREKMSDYKNTLNLPETAFPMKANLAQREPEILARWSALDLYGLRKSARVGAEKFIVHDGPPYANGNIHLGHAFNKILKDIIAKAYFLSGYDTDYVPGWDCHGLPIEINVEKKFGKVGEKISAKDFRTACRAYAQEHVNYQSQDFQRLGVIGNWGAPYLTMDKSFEAKTNLAQKNYLTQGFKPVHWCFSCQSSLAEAEVEYQDKTSLAIDVKFTAVNSDAFEKKFGVKGSGDISVVIWTTTPWTLPANYAVALNPDVEYALVQVGNERFVLAQTLVDDCMQRYSIQDYAVLATLSGAQLEKLPLQHPFLDRTSLLVLSDHVTVDAGTGAVHIAPAHGEDDFRVGKKYGLPLDSPVQGDGVFNSDVVSFTGEHIFKANDKIILLLAQSNKLVHEAKLQHSYPHCWRHKTPVIFRATPQWFVSMERLRGEALAVLPSVNWYPKWGEERMRIMIENRPDWCISRQRSWGVPITVFVHNDTQQLHPRTIELMTQIAGSVYEHGIEAWFELDPKELLGSDAAHYRKITDVLDVWFESGVSHYCVLQARSELAFPAGVYLEGSDQYRGWFQSSLLTSVAMNKKSPFQHLISHGYTVDAQGRKMSKSLGNVIAPEKIIKSSGADILRLWAATADYTAEIAISDEILQRTSDTYRRIRNTARFLLSNLANFDYERDHVIAGDMVKLDRWAVEYTESLQSEIMANYKEFDLHNVVQKVHHFCSIQLGGFCLDIWKDRFYTLNNVARRSAQTAMYHILEALVRWIAPILSFTADEIWHYMPGVRSKSVHLESWYEGFIVKCDPDYDNDFWEKIRGFREEVNLQLEMKRATKEIGSSLEANVTIYVNDLNFKVLLDKLSDELRFVLITSAANVVHDRELNASSDFLIEVVPSPHLKCERCWHRVPLSNHPEHLTICDRCVTNITTEAGEVRLFA